MGVSVILNSHFSWSDESRGDVHAAVNCAFINDEGSNIGFQFNSSIDAEDFRLLASGLMNFFIDAEVNVETLVVIDSQDDTRVNISGNINDIISTLLLQNVMERRTAEILRDDADISIILEKHPIQLPDVNANTNTAKTQPSEGYKLAPDSLMATAIPRNSV